MPALALLIASLLPQEPAPPAKVALQMRCSSAVLEAAQALAEEYHKLQPAITIAVSGGGSQVALSALIDGTTDLAVTTRPIGPEDLAAARRNGFEPLEQIIASDALAIVVHKDNPIESLTIARLMAMWSAQGATTQWSQLGVKLADGVPDRVQLAGTRNGSAAYEHFRGVLSGRGDSFRADAVASNTSADVLAFVEKTPNAIAFCNSASVVGKEVRIVPIAAKEGAKPTLPGVTDGSYPLARPIYLYTHDRPRSTAKEFAAWITGKAGQAVLKTRGLLPRPH